MDAAGRGGRGPFGVGVKGGNTHVLRTSTCFPEYFMRAHERAPHSPFALYAKRVCTGEKKKLNHHHQ